MDKIITEDEIQQVTKILSKLEPGNLPIEIFYQFARLYVTPIIELVPIRMVDVDTVKILAVKRDADDPYWPGMLHTPGTVLRPTDTSVKIALDRIIKNELTGIELKSEPVFVDYEFQRVNRGMELALIFYVEYVEAIKESTEMDLNDLPDNLVDTQINFINKVAKLYGSQNN